MAASASGKGKKKRPAAEAFGAQEADAAAAADVGEESAAAAQHGTAQMVDAERVNDVLADAAEVVAKVAVQGACVCTYA